MKTKLEHNDVIFNSSQRLAGYPGTHQLVGATLLFFKEKGILGAIIVNLVSSNTDLKKNI